MGCRPSFCLLTYSRLAVPELMHVGSLIVDDIQDKSESRRGGPSWYLRPLSWLVI